MTRTRTRDVAHRVHEVRVGDPEPASAVAAKAAAWRSCVARELHGIAREHLPGRLQGRRPWLLQRGLRRLLRAPGTSLHDALNMRAAGSTNNTCSPRKAQRCNAKVTAEGFTFVLQNLM